MLNTVDMKPYLSSQSCYKTAPKKHHFDSVLMIDVQTKTTIGLCNLCDVTCGCNCIKFPHTSLHDGLVWLDAFKAFEGKTYPKPCCHSNP